MNTRPSWENYATHDQSAYPQLWRGCVGAWCPSLGPTGSKLFDLSGNGYHGTLSGATPETVWSSLFGGMYHLKFDGSNDEVIVGDRPRLRLTSVTISLWATIGALDQANRVLAGKYNSNANDRAYQLYVNTSENPVWTAQSAGTPFDATKVATGATVMAVDRWYHLCGVLNSGGYPQLYVNGVLDGSAANPSSGYQSSAPFEIGCANNSDANSFLNGRVNDIRVYNRRISEAEIRLLARRQAIAYESRRSEKTFVFMGQPIVAGAGGGGGGGDVASSRLAKPLSWKLSQLLSLR